MSGTLSELVARLHERGQAASLVGIGDPVIEHVAMDSRRIGPGALFAAVRGQHADGHDHLGEAVANGAVAVLVEDSQPGLRLPQLVVTATRPAVAVAAAWSSGFPSRRLGVVGVTGTDGKTTTSYLIRAMLEAAGLQTGLAGTIDVIVGGRSIGNPARTTTPEAPELQALLRAMVEAGDRWAVLEASSHGLAQHRLDEIAWDVAVLTNVTEEHLEFHGTLDAYVAAKRRLFEALAVGAADPPSSTPRTAVLNLDDPVASDFARVARDVGARVIAYAAAAAADVRLLDVRPEVDRLRVELATPRWQGQLALQLAGRYNAHNALAAVAVGEALELDADAIRVGLEDLTAVPGRMERIDEGQPFVVVVDYAHTADALAKVLDELAPVARTGGGELIAVFGSAGDRDRVKRPAMGRVAGSRCRLVVLTDEDPRSEDRQAILDEIAQGAEAEGRQRGTDLLLVADRATAIREAFAAARPGDVVLLAGKGHEKTIEMADGDVPWDEAREARRALAEAGWGAPS